MKTYLYFFLGYLIKDVVEKEIDTPLFSSVFLRLFCFRTCPLFLCSHFALSYVNTSRLFFTQHLANAWCVIGKKLKENPKHIPNSYMGRAISNFHFARAIFLKIANFQRFFFFLKKIGRRIMLVASFFLSISALPPL